MTDISASPADREPNRAASRFERGLRSLNSALTTAATDPKGISTALSEMQQLGLEKADLRVHIERLRAVNDASDLVDYDYEDACVLALDMIEGLAGPYSLDWSAARIAPIYLARVLTPAKLRTAAEFAFVPHDMLPPRPLAHINASFLDELSEYLHTEIADGGWQPQQCDVFRVPKAKMTTRPAALLAPMDRVVYEALADFLTPGLASALPPQVTWPRGRSVGAEVAAAAHGDYAQSPRDWDSDYVVIADVESFYDSVDHRLLADVTRRQFGQSTSYARALRLFLEAVTGRQTGLPQGPLASDVFAGALLAGVDAHLSKSGRLYSRYADDFLIAARTVADARRAIESLEESLSLYGLGLSATKTRVMRRSKYVENLGKSTSPEVESLRRNQQRKLESALLQTEDQETASAILSELGVDDETMWDVFYHGTVSFDEILRDRREQLMPSLLDGYAEYFDHLSNRLSLGEFENSLESVERDFRECFAFLGAGSRPVNLDSVSSAVEWFPRLAEPAAKYLSAISHIDPNGVARGLHQWIVARQENDWVTAWMTHAAETSISRVSELLTASLEFAALNADPLTRTGAVWALIKSGNLDDETWKTVIDTVSSALRAELYFGNGRFGAQRAALTAHHEED